MRLSIHHSAIIITSKYIFQVYTLNENISFLVELKPGLLLSTIDDDGTSGSDDDAD